MKYSEQLLDKIHNNNPLVTHLNLSNQIIDDIKAQAIAAALIENRSLISIDLSFNKITAGGASAIAQSLEDHPLLTILNLQNNQIGSEGVLCIIEALKKNRVLKSINLKLNSIHLNSSQTEDLFEMLSINNSLQAFELGWNDEHLHWRNISPLSNNNKICISKIAEFSKLFEKNNSLISLSLTAVSRYRSRDSEGYENCLNHTCEEERKIREKLRTNIEKQFISYNETLNQVINNPHDQNCIKETLIVTYDFLNILQSTKFIKISEIRKSHINLRNEADKLLNNFSQDCLRNKELASLWYLYNKTNIPKLAGELGRAIFTSEIFRDNLNNDDSSHLIPAIAFLRKDNIDFNSQRLLKLQLSSWLFPEKSFPNLDVFDGKVCISLSDLREIIKQINYKNYLKDIIVYAKKYFQIRPVTPVFFKQNSAERTNLNKFDKFQEVVIENYGHIIDPNLKISKTLEERYDAFKKIVIKHLPEYPIKVIDFGYWQEQSGNLKNLSFDELEELCNKEPLSQLLFEKYGTTDVVPIETIFNSPDYFGSETAQIKPSEFKEKFSQVIQDISSSQMNI